MTTEYYVELLDTRKLDNDEVEKQIGSSMTEVCMDAARESIRLVMDAPSDFGSFFQCVRRMQT